MSTSDPPAPPGAPSSADSSSASSAESGLHDITELLRRARRGLRSDVAPLAAALDRGALFVPLARSIEGIPLGEAVQPEEGELSLAPHLLPERDGVTFVPLFSDRDVLRSIAGYLDWQTEGRELEFCTLPARVAIDLALELVDGERIVGAVINPSDETELVLQRHELGSLSQGRALPLVGYVEAIPRDPNSKPLIAELDIPPSPALLAAIEACVARFDGVLGYRLEQTFDAERDLEPHPTLTIELDAETSFDQRTFSHALFDAVEGKLPEPGYIDVLFEPRDAPENA